MVGTSITFITVGLVLASLYWLAQRRKLHKKPPPGPPGLPIIGNVFDMPSENECHKFAEWQMQYGDLVSLNMAGVTIVICNSYDKAVDLLDKRGAVFSDRAQAPMATDLVGWKKNLAFLQYGKKLRDGRKLFYQEFGHASALQKFLGHQEDASLQYLEALLKAPEDFEKSTFEHAGALIMRLTYGYVHQDQDLAALANKVMKCAGLAAAPSHFWVNMFPMLKYIPAWFPGAGFQRKAAEWRQDMLEMVNKPFRFTEGEIASGTAPPSFVSRVLPSIKSSSDMEDIKWLAGSMFAGGSDTTYSTLMSFFLAMTLFPDIQRKAQEEIDDVVGLHRLPTLSDRPNMKYLDALVQEVYRFFSVVPIGIPHVSNEDSVYDGYFIPKGSIVFQNLWLMSHDPKIYKNPMDFNPNRFMGPNPEQDVRDYCFGFGRRACPGKQLADQSVWLSCARILAAFNVLQLPDQPLPKVSAAPGIVTHPETFKCTIKVRSARVLNLISGTTSHSVQ